jgi:hypothetical protein
MAIAPGQTRGALLFCAVAFLATACVSGGDIDRRSPGDASRALQLVQAADLLGLKDAEAPQSAGTPGISPTLPSAALVGGLNTLSPPFGFGSAAAGALGFASMFFDGPGPASASGTTLILAWAPKELAASEIEAWRLIDSRVQEALAAALQETRLAEPYRVERSERKTKSYRPSKTLFPTAYDGVEVSWRIKGGDCDLEKVACRYVAALPVPPVETRAPALLGGYPAWGYVRTQGMASISSTFIDNREFRSKFRAVFPDLEVLRKASARLPEWIAIYVAPNTMAHLNDTAGKPSFIPYPLVLQGGTALFFVRGG